MMNPRNLTKKLMEVPLAPILIGVFPISTLIVNNFGQLNVEDVPRPIILTLVISVTTWYIVSRFFDDQASSALVASLIILLIFSYGHFYELLKLAPHPLLNFVRHRYLLPVLIIILFAIIAGTRRLVSDRKITLRHINSFSLLMIGIPCIQLAFLALNRAVVPPIDGVETGGGFQSLSNPEPSREILPDIYFIVLDEYARADTLLEKYGFDNSEFLENLEAMGFYVASCSQSNYVRTRLSLASQLNLVYLEDLGPSMEPDDEKIGWLNEFIKRSYVRRSLEDKGYTIVAFKTWYPWADLNDADLVIEPEIPSELVSFRMVGLNKFELLYLETTVGKLLIDGTIQFRGDLVPSMILADQKDRLRVKGNLDMLEQMTEIPGPKFVHAHIISPHGPYVFGPNGELPDPTQTEMEGYVNQVRYLSLRMLEILPKLISESDVEPIVIIQSDHGAKSFDMEDSMEKYAHFDNVLNAMYLPEEDNGQLYNSISLVNSFRVVFNYAFGTEFSMLPDISYYSPTNRPFDFVKLPYECEE